MTGPNAGPNMGSLEDLVREIQRLPADTPEFDLWVPDNLTYQGDSITLEAAMAVVLNELLAREMFPDGFEQGSGGRMYRYRHESTGRRRSPVLYNSVCHWVVQALRSVGIGPKRRNFEPGQVWRYRTRTGEEESRVQILKVDVDPKAGEIIHIAVNGIRIERSAGDLTPISILGHVPVARQALEASELVFEAENTELPEFEEGYHMWRTGFEAGNAGVFSVPVAEIVDVMEATIRGGAA